MCTWAVVYLHRTGTLMSDSFLPLIIGMAFDCAIVYWIASGIAGKAL